MILVVPCCRSERTQITHIFSSRARASTSKFARHPANAYTKPSGGKHDCDDSTRAEDVESQRAQPRGWQARRAGNLASGLERDTQAVELFVQRSTLANLLGDAVAERGLGVAPEVLNDTQPQDDLHTRMRQKLQRNARRKFKRCRTSCCCSNKELRLGWLRGSKRSSRIFALREDRQQHHKRNVAGAATTFGAATGSKGTNGGHRWRRRHSRSGHVPEEQAGRLHRLTCHADMLCIYFVSR